MKKVESRVPLVKRGKVLVGEFECPEPGCGAVRKTRARLNLHRRTHQDPAARKRYPCLKGCSKSFTTSANRSRHHKERCKGSKMEEDEEKEEGGIECCICGQKKQEDVSYYCNECGETYCDECWPKGHADLPEHVRLPAGTAFPAGTEWLEARAVGSGPHTVLDGLETWCGTHLVKARRRVGMGLEPRVVLKGLEVLAKYYLGKDPVLTLWPDHKAIELSMKCAECGTLYMILATYFSLEDMESDFKAAALRAAEYFGDAEFCIADFSRRRFDEATKSIETLMETDELVPEEDPSDDDTLQWLSMHRKDPEFGLKVGEGVIVRNGRLHARAPQDDHKYWLRHVSWPDGFVVIA